MALSISREADVGIPESAIACSQMSTPMAGTCGSWFAVVATWRTASEPRRPYKITNEPVAKQGVCTVCEISTVQCRAHYYLQASAAFKRVLDVIHDARREVPSVMRGQQRGGRK